MNNKLLVGVIFLVGALIVWVGVTFYIAYQPKALQIQGEVDAQYYNISSKLAGRISEINVRKGDVVSVGDLVFVISSPEAQAKLKQAKAGRKAAGAMKLQANNGARKQEIQAAYSQWQKAKAGQELFLKTYQRIKKLYESGVVAEQKHDEVYTQWQASKYNETSAKQLYLLAKTGARYETKIAAREQEKVYEGKVDEVEAFIKEQHQFAFKAGEVVEVLIHEGELSPTGFPVVSIVDINDSWIKFHIREDLLPQFKKYKKFDVLIPAIDSEKTFEYAVSYISVMGEFASWKAAAAGKGYDLKSFEVEMRPTKNIEGLRVGMSVLLSL